MEYRLGIYEKAMPNEYTWRERLEAAKKGGFDFLEISVDESDARLPAWSGAMGRSVNYTISPALWGFPLRPCASADTASIPWEAVFPRSVREAWTL